MELYLNDTLVDLDDRIPFPLTFNISDIKDLTARKGNNSKTIKLPGTARNYQLMVQVFSLSASEVESTLGSTLMNFDPSVRIPARYYNDGLLEFQGVAQLTACSLIDKAWTFEIILISETIDYVGRLSKIKLSELDMSEYNHLYTRANQLSNWTGNIQVNGITTPNVVAGNYTGLGYYYGLIDYGFPRTVANEFAVDQIPPQVFVYDILKKAFTYCGLTWESKFLETQLFKRLLLAFEGGDLPAIDSTASAAGSVTSTENNDGSGNLIYLFFLGLNNLWTDQYQYDPVDVTIVTDPATQMQSLNPGIFVAESEGTFTVDYYGEHQLDFELTNANAPVSLNYEVQLFIFLDNAIISSDSIYSGYLDQQSGLVSLSLNFNYSRDMYLQINQALRFEIKLSVTNINSIGVDASPYMEVTLTSIDVHLDIIKKIQALTAGSLVSLSTFMPQMDAGTFFKGLVTMFNLYVKPSVDDPSVMEIEPLNDFYNSSNDAVNWSYIVDRSKEMTVVPTINYAAKAYRFQFDPDDDYFNTKYRTDINKNYGDFEINSQNQFATSDADFKLPFAQKLLSRIPFDDLTFTDLIVPRNFQLQVNENGSSEVTKKKGKPFIVQLGRMRDGNWIHIDENGAAFNELRYPYVGHLNDIDNPTFDLNFGTPDYVYWQTGAYTTNNLYFYHEKFIKETLSRFGKELTCYVNLDSNLINKLNFRDLVMIDGVVFRLQSVKDYDSGKNVSTKVELIRIIEGQGIEGKVVIVPFDPYGKQNRRQTEDNEFRVTEDNEARIIE
jgi:hypothetical protein